MKLSNLFLVLFIILIGCSKDSENKPVLSISGISPTSGPKTSIVTITGGGFSINAAENIVTLNDFPCPVIKATTTNLKLPYLPKQDRAT